EKAHCILPHFAKQNEPVVYCPIDISAAALARCQRDVDDISGVKVVPIEAAYIDGLASALKLRKPGTSMLTLFLGSSIGNFDWPVAETFLRAVRENLRPGDALLLSTDLVKAHDRMLAAYDDAIGLTAAFNLNLLARINRELSANFRVNQFQHEARYDGAEQRIEMHLRSKSAQTVSVNGNFFIKLEEGETIWTESSYKFREEQIRVMSARAGFDCEVQWVDAEWPFAQSVLRAR
ncbi:MAG: L-histidine N(alpha)-methyltransferase, partial [Acidobacteria bacterium]|nr:L-histidine N(alpha)-methyltransferase [Acidobacteriota bacterium]